MDALRLVPAAELSPERLARLLNRAYADYYVPVWLDPFQFERMCKDMDVDLRRSVVAVGEARDVGLALFSQRGSEGWISGVGVRPSWRRQGVARQMIAHLQRQAKAEGLQRLRLEVLEQNEGATLLYEQLGFSWLRDLLVMTVSGGCTSLNCHPTDIAPAHPIRLLGAHHCFHSCDPSWQRDLPSLEKRAPHLQGLALWQEEQLVGYTLYQPRRKALTVLDLAVDPAHPHRLKAARRLLQALHRTRPDMGGYAVNVPAQDPLLPAFIECGYQIWQRQYEMSWSVP